MNSTRNPLQRKPEAASMVLLDFEHAPSSRPPNLYYTR